MIDLRTQNIRDTPLEIFFIIHKSSQHIIPFKEELKRMKKIGISLAVLMLMVLTVLTVSPAIACAPGKITGGGHGETLLSSGVPAGSFGFNVMYSEGDPAPKGELEYIDHSTGMNVHGHTMTDLVIWPISNGKKGRWAGWFSGECTIDGVSGYTFRVDVEDNGEPGVNDVFWIRIYEGGVMIYQSLSHTTTLLVGNIQIHVGK